jgi:hypothetical protein
MTNRELQYIIEEIKKKEKTDLQEIARSVGKNRSYLSKLINSEDEREITKALLRDFKEVYPAYFVISNKNNTSANGQTSRNYILDGTSTIYTLSDYINLLRESKDTANADKERILAALERVASVVESINTIKINSNETLKRLEKILVVDRSDHKVTLASLDRLEHQPEGSNQKESNKSQLAIEKRLRNQNKDKSGQGKKDR